MAIILHLPRFGALLFVIFLIIQGNFCAAQPDTKPIRPKPYQICAGLFAAVRQYHQFGSNSSSFNKEVMNDLRIFRISLGVGDPKGAILDLNLDSRSIRPRSVKQLTSQLYGQELMASQKEGADTSQETVVASVKLTGLAEIESFYNDTEDLAGTVEELANSSYRVINKVKRLAQATLATGIVGLHLSGFPILGELGLVLGPALLVTTEPFALLAYFVRKDQRFIDSVKKLEQFTNDPEKKSGDWIYDSWQYSPKMGLTNEVWRNGLAGSNTQRAIGMQDMWDSRGTFFSIYRKYETAGKNLTGEKTVWFGVDRLIQINDDGQPVMWLTVRTSLQRPIFPATVSEKQKSELELPSALLPVTLPSRN